MLYTTAHNQQPWSTNELMKKKNWFQCGNFSSILNENIKWHYNQIELNSNIFNSNLIEEKWNANWWEKCWKSVCGYDVKKCFKKENIDLKRHNSTLLYLGMHTSLPENALNRFQFGGV